jgi:secreted PhoX family phosphatase
MGGNGGSEGGGPAVDGGAGAPAMPSLTSRIADIGPLGPADANGVLLPEGFTSRILARTGQAPIDGGNFLWHGAPDGGATYDSEDGGWIYVSNSESVPGGVGALKFDAEGNLIDAYRILDGSIINCAGGRTPWGTWLSCEELANTGRVFECDPSGATAGIFRPALGLFKHEAAAVDPVNNHVYLSEDEGDGRLYRYVPDALTAEGFADLNAGRLEVAQVMPDNTVNWLPLPDPSGTSGPTRLQVPESTAFDGGEGLYYYAGTIYLATKGDNRVWAYDIEGARISVIYDAAEIAMPTLRGVDNIVVSCCGDVLVVEDGDNMQVNAILPNGTVKTLVQIEGHVGSEITGPAFDPSGTRLYFSSQRGPNNDLLGGGVTYEVTGPFHAA